MFDRGEVVTTGVYGDMFGQWVSAYAPIRDSLGRVVALLEADYRVQQVLDQLWRELLEFLLFTWVGLTVTFLLARRLSTRLAQPLQELTAAVDAAAAGDNERELPKDAPDEIGRLARHFGVMREAIQRARMNERLAVVGQMAGSLVHDLRGPIQVISGNAELLPGEEEPQERAKMATRIVEQGRRMEAMCQDVLEFTRGRHTLAFSSFAASSLVDDVLADLAPVAARRAVRLARGPTSEQQVSGDADKLRRVLYNLGKNAIEAVGSGKTVELGCSVEAERWKLTVRDEGPGIPPEVAERLFQPFATHGKSGGTGLGLAIVKSVADAHGGSVRFETAAGSGTTFSVELPRAPAAPSPKPAAG
ncbi:MAG: HAMP domain-containing histidine kinase [Candidatus Wallbacteria bacterium]|nr:HAMP domain-containing histidine kinase [Candidatus Wallbacteria bacterium]